MKNNWSLVVHEVGCEYAKIAVGTLFANERKFDEFQVVLRKDGNIIQQILIPKEDFPRPFSGQKKRFYKLITLGSLSPSTDYDVEFCLDNQVIDGVYRERKIFSSGTFRTLPDGLKPSDKPFVVALGSCFYDEDDGKRTASAYQALRCSGNNTISPDVKFLLGDQVYLDIGIDSLSRRPVEITSRIADEYARAWQSLREMLRNGGTWMLADDHEFWNDYPQISKENPYLWMLRYSAKLRAAWKRASRDGVFNVQNVKPIRTFRIGNDLSFCFADVRTYRTEKQFLDKQYFDQLIGWSESLASPGVLVLSQPLMVKPNKGGDMNLANYKEQYERLLTALASTGYDVVVLAGDVHFGRVGSVELGGKGCTLHEIISSPLSNLSGPLGIDGKFAASIAVKMDQFPAEETSALMTRKVIYNENWRVEPEHIGKWYKPGFEYNQTKEHIFTLAFSKLPNGKVKLEVQAWRIRHQYSNDLPHREFDKKIEIFLQ